MVETFAAECRHIRDANDMVDRVVKGETDRIADLYAFPAAVYFGTRVIVLESREEFRLALDAYRRILMRNGLAMISTEVTGVEERGATASVRVANRYHRSDGSEIGRARIRYFAQGDPGPMKIRLVEYLEWPCAEEIARDETITALSSETRCFRKVSGDD